MFETLVLGRPKCGVFVKLNDSKRNWSKARSVNRKSRESETSVLIAPGPRRELKPALPKPTVVTGANASGSNQERPLPISPMIWTLGFTWLARWVAPGILSEVPEAETENGRPVMKAAIEFSRQPPKMAAPAPLVAQDLPFPKGSSHMPESARL